MGAGPALGRTPVPRGQDCRGAHWHGLFSPQTPIWGPGQG